jgi:hypothetical protein
MKFHLELEIPASATSYWKDKLSVDYVKEFNTPTIQVLQSHPMNNAAQWSLNPLMFVFFDQEVEASKTLHNVECFISGTKKHYSTGGAT